MTNIPRRLSAIMVLTATLSATGPAVAQVPPADFFTGLYERVGRDADGELISDFVRLDPAGEGLKMSLCPISDSAAPLAELYLATFEGVDLLIISLGDTEIWCEFYKHEGSYAMIFCEGVDSKEKFTLWPLPNGGADGCGSAE